MSVGDGLNAADYLGELATDYEAYREVMATTPEGTTLKIPHRQEIVTDKLREAIQKVNEDTSLKELAEIREKANLTTVDARKHHLLKAGIAGSITSLFAKVMVAETETELEALKPEVSLYHRIPKERRLGALAVNEGGYRWGGFFNKFEELAE